MAKLRPGPVSRDVFKRFLSEKDDFAFELKALAGLRGRPSIQVLHGGAYADPITGKRRQYDFRITFRTQSALHAAMAVEAKNIQSNFPLLISCVPRIGAEAFHELLVPTTLAERSTDPERRVTKTTRSWKARGPYPPGEMVGKSIAQVGLDEKHQLVVGDAEIYEKWSQAVNSAYDMVALAEPLHLNPVPVRRMLIVPVVVIPDGNLWVQDYAADGTAVGEPHQAEEVPFYLSHSPVNVGPLETFTITHLHFLTLSALPKFVDRMLMNEMYSAKFLIEEADANV